MDRFNLKVSTSKSKTMTFQGKNNVRCRITVNNIVMVIMEQTDKSYYLGFSMSHCQNKETY